MPNMTTKRFFYFSNRNIAILILLALVYRVLSAYFNFGIVAVDDYLTMIRNFLPGQDQVALSKMLFSDSVHPRGPILFLRFLARLCYSLGFTDPLTQLRLIYSFMGAASLASGVLLSSIFISLKRKDLFVISLCLFGFYFLSPFVGTRVMNENFAFIFINISIFFLFHYYWQRKTKFLYGFVLTLSLASYCRFQSGFLIFSLLPFIFQKKFRKDLLHFFVVATIGFVFTGVLDLLIFDQFHFGLKKYLTYNYHYSNSYSSSPFYNYILFFIACSIPPALFLKFKLLDWKTQYKYLLPVFYSLIFFLVIHSAVPHKEDRFMFPVLGLFFVLIVPLLDYLLLHGHRVRLAYFCAFQLVVGGLTAFYPSQWNSIGVVRFLEGRPDISRLINIQRSLQFVPLAYISRANFQVFEVNEFKPENYSMCNNAILVRFDKVEKLDLSNYKEIASFHPGPLESLLVRLNPKNNARRGHTILMRAKHCE